MHLLQTLNYIFFISVTLINQSLSTDVISKNNTKEALIPGSQGAQVAVEGGTVPDTSQDRTHSSREHVTDNKSSISEIPKNPAVTKSPPLANSSVVKLEKETVKSVAISSVVVKNSTVHPNSSSNSESIKSLNKTVSTTTTELPKKPLKTVHDEIDPMDPSVKSDMPPPKMSSLDPTLADKNNRRANYVVPIVAVILSVPVVAYVMSILYKRGSDWWQHRNYRRMDYLIEGMYNS